MSLIMIGIDAIEHVLKKAKKTGMKEFGQGWVVNIRSGVLQRTFPYRYKTSGEVPDSPVQVAWLLAQYPNQRDASIIQVFR